MIDRIEVVPISLRLVRALSFASGDLREEEYMVVRVRDGGGACGESVVPVRPMFYGESLASMAYAVLTWFGPQMLGKAAFDVEQLLRLTDRVPANTSAKCALELALFDLQGKLLGRPCYDLLGGKVADLRATYVLGLASPEHTVEEAQELRSSHGIGCFKVKVSHDWRRGIAACKMLRRAFGEDLLLYLDANMSWEFHEALEALRAFADLGIAWVEEPLRTLDAQARSSFRTQSPMRVMQDEARVSEGEIHRSIADREFDIVSVKCARTGYRRSQGIAAACRAHGLQPMLGSQGDEAHGTLAAAHFGVSCAAAAMPAESSYFLGLAQDVVEDPPEISDGWLRLTDAPGVGVSLSPALVARYATASAQSVEV